jgi:hypothetical protein
LTGRRETPQYNNENENRVRGGPKNGFLKAYGKAKEKRRDEGP